MNLKFGRETEFQSAFGPIYFWPYWANDVNNGSRLTLNKALNMSVSGRPVSHSVVQMTELVLPSHTNALGTIFGGIIMSWVDIAAAIAAQRHSGQPVVTASIDALNFVAPVHLGWVVNLKASVNYAGKTSMEIGVRVDAENPITGEKFHTASAYLTFVAIGSNGKPRAVHPVIAETVEEKRRFQAAIKRREIRLQRREK